jgi:hypothetical protein
MTHINRWIGIGAVCAMTMLPLPSFGAPNTGGGPTTHDCAGVPQTCGAWGAKGNNTCRSCQQAQCKTENGKDVMAGNKTTTECYEGHGAPPSRTAPSTKLQRAPMVSKGAVMGRGVEGEQQKASEESSATKP